MKHLKRSLSNPSSSRSALLAVVLGALGALGAEACASQPSAEPTTPQASSGTTAQPGQGGQGGPGGRAAMNASGTTAGAAGASTTDPNATGSDPYAGASTPAASTGDALPANGARGRSMGNNPTDAWGHGVGGAQRSDVGSTNAMTGDSALPDVSTLNDAQLAAVVQAVHAGEIEEAQLAANKGTSPDVKRFARDMSNAHRDMQAKSAALLSRLQITPSECPASAQLKSDTQNELSTLQTMRGREFDRDYIDAQVRSHNQALDLLDRIVPNVKNPDLKMALTNDRPKVEGHLREAERLQQSLQKGTTSLQP